jgi:hypothetical protein
MRLKLSKFITLVKSEAGYHSDYEYDPEVEFVGIKWQEEHHPSAELFPIEFIDAKSTGKGRVTLKFVTTKHNQ